MKLFYMNFLLCGLIVMSGITTHSYAQSLDPQLDPSRIQERLPESMREQSLPSAVDIPLIEGLPKKDSIEKPADAKNFPVKKIILLNNSVFSDKELQQDISGAVGDKVSIYDLHLAALNITNRYREEGYVFSKAFIPPQTVENDTVTIEVVEGYVDQVEHRGIPVSKQSPIHRYSKRLSEQRPVTKDDLERYMLLINDLSGIQAKVLAAPIDNLPGAVKLVFLIDQNTHAASLSFNNRGSDALGPAQAIASYQANDLLGFGEQTRFIHLRTPTNNELSYISASQSWPIGAEGGIFSYHLRQSLAEPGESATAFDIESTSNSVALDFYYPWIRTRQETLSTRLSADLRNSATESFDTQIIDDHLRYIRAEAAYRRQHHRGVTDIKTKFSYGLDVMNATTGEDIQKSRLGSGDAHKWQADIIRHQALYEDWSLTLKATGQWAFDPLLSAELFGLGGTSFGRAFDFSTITGDSGYAGSAQLTYAVPEKMEFIDRLALYGFLDGGQVFDETNVVGNDWQSLASTGIGIDVAAFKFLHAKLELARPLQIRGNIDHSMEVYGTIGLQFTY